MTNPTKWEIDHSHSEIAFKVRHLMIAHVKGTFKTFDASIYTTGKDFKTAQIDLWIDVASIRTGDEKRDAHLVGADFFDVEHHKQITFTATEIGKEGADLNHEMWGALTMAGVTKNIKLYVQFGGLAKDHLGQEKAGFTVSGKINRNDWGLAWNSLMETGGLILSEEVSISCEIQLLNAGYKDLVMELEPADGKKAMV